MHSVTDFVTIYTMSSKKKRNKQYKGSVPTRPTITRMSAVNRHPLHQWWVDHKQVAKPVLIIAGIVIAIVIILIGVIDLIW